MHGGPLNKATRGWEVGLTAPAASGAVTQGSKVKFALTGAKEHVRRGGGIAHNHAYLVLAFDGVRHPGEGIGGAEVAHDLRLAVESHGELIAVGVSGGGLCTAAVQVTGVPSICGLATLGVRVTEGFWARPSEGSPTITIKCKHA